MKEPLVILLCMVTISNCAPFSELSSSYPTIEFDGGFDQSKGIEDASGVMVLQSGPVSLTAGRDSSGKLAGGLGLYEIGDILLGKFGKVSIKGMSTVDGLYNALVDTEVFTGPRSYNPMTLSVSRKRDGVEFIGSSELGYIGGTYVTSTQSNVIPEFEVHLNTDGWVTAVARGRVKDGRMMMSSYNAGFNLGIVSGAMNMDGDRNITDYELGASLGLLHGTVKINRTKRNERSYKAGVSLGVVNFATEINADSTKSYNTELDTGIFRFTYNVNKDDSINWKGSVDLSNIGIDCEQTREGITIAGGRIQIGSSVVNIHRDSTGHFTVKVNRGSIVE